MRIGAGELILIVVIILLLFGGAKLSGLGKALGQSIKDFRHAMKDDDKTQVEQHEQDENRETAEKVDAADKTNDGTP
jgi:sec-independent protein translocase protein TatA